MKLKIALQSTVQLIEDTLLKKLGCKMYFTKEFNDFGTDGAVRNALARMVKNGILIRLARGIFYYPIIDKSAYRNFSAHS